MIKKTSDDFWGAPHASILAGIELLISFSAFTKDLLNFSGKTCESLVTILTCKWGKL